MILWLGKWAYNSYKWSSYGTLLITGDGAHGWTPLDYEQSWFRASSDISGQIIAFSHDLIR